MAKPVTPQDMFDLWQKMVNPGAYPLQSLMFPVLDAKELERKVAELETVEHWLKANLNMLQLTIKSLEYQRQMVKGGERIRAAMEEGEAGAGAGEDLPNPAMWAWNMMTQAGNDAAGAMGRAVEAAGEAAQEAGRDGGDARPKPRKKRKPRARPG
ncbi:MAG TPA: hypothetical protein PK042_11010 [Usitatibacteraceae bacterium]|nr:hypothetical protein [Usitatibacteraceae bacterium]